MNKATYVKIASATLLLLILAMFATANLQLNSTVSAQSSGNIWYVSIGGTLPGYPLDEGYGFYPHVIVIDAGDTVVWTVVTSQEHTVTFFSGQPSFNGDSPQSLFPIPCSPSAPNVYNGTGICSSGMLFQGQQYNLTFTTPGVYVYSCAFHAGMQGVVVVQPKGAPYPYTQQQYNVMAQQEMGMDLGVIQLAQEVYQPVVKPGPSNNTIYYVATGYQPQQVATASLSAVNGSGVTGNVSIQVTGTKTSVVNLTLTGLTPGKSYSAALLFGSSQYGEATGYSPINLGSFTPNSTTYSTVFTINQNLSVVQYYAVELPMAGLYMNVYSSPNNVVASGDIMYSNGIVMGFLPSVLTIYSGDTVVWVDQEPNDAHTVTYVPLGMQTPAFGAPASFEATGNNTVFNPANYYNSGEIYYGQSYVLTFDTPGVYTIQCLIHNEFGMSGYVIVLPKPTSTTLIQRFNNTVIQRYNTTIPGPTTDNSARLLAGGGIVVGLVALGIAAVAARKK